MDPNIITIAGYVTLPASLVLGIISLVAHRKTRSANAANTVSQGAAAAVTALQDAVTINRELADQFKSDFKELSMKYDELEVELRVIRETAASRLIEANKYESAAQQYKAIADQLKKENKELREKVETLTDRLEELLSDPESK